MKLLNININKYLLLEQFSFVDSENNIDALNSKAVASNNIDEKFSLLNLATHKIEKFHSFFHFEQSYFYTKLAIEYLKIGKIEEAKKQLESAIFQDHVNQQALALFRNLESNHTYSRPFTNFNEYLEFATGEKGQCEASSYWVATDTQTIIDTIRDLHLHYHQESAKLYLNRAVIFHGLQEYDLAKNDLIKANNLDNKLKEREYYPLIIAQLGVVVVLGLGSNLGDRQFYLLQAVQKLKELDILSDITSSSIEETKAYLEPNSLAEWDLNYLNMAVKGVTMLSPEQLLKALKDIEHSLGRENHERCAPRQIDLDILAYGDQVIQLDDLQIPHASLLQRAWALKPFAEMYPEWQYPVEGRYYQRTIKELYEKYQINRDSQHNS